YDALPIYIQRQTSGATALGARGCQFTPVTAGRTHRASAIRYQSTSHLAPLAPSLIALAHSQSLVGRPLALRTAQNMRAYILLLASPFAPEQRSAAARLVF